MIRDDGENGLWISHPATPNTMYKISRDEFRANWKMWRSEQQQQTAPSIYEKGNPYETLGLGGMTFDEQKSGPVEKRETKMNSQDTETAPVVIGGQLT